MKSLKAKAQPKILVVDDQADLREALCRGLEARGYWVRAADSAYQALKELQGQNFDLLVTDFSMPGGDGLELMKRAAALPGAPSMVMVSGQESIRVSHAFAYGAEAVFPKPFDHHAFFQTVDEIISYQGRPRAGLRTKAVLSIAVQFPTARLVGTVTDLSKGGFFLACPQPLPRLGEVGHFRLETSQPFLPVLEGEAVVRWLREGGRECGVGFEFCSLIADTHQQMMHYVNFLRTKSFIPAP